MIEVRRLPKPAILVRQAAAWTRELCADRREYYREPEFGERTDKPKYPRAHKSRYAHQRLKGLLQPSMPYVAMTRARLDALGIDPETL